METGWLIEYPTDPRYGRESWYCGADGFTLDSLAAVRYARREDAVREISRFPVSLAKVLRAEEHSWCDPLPQPATYTAEQLQAFAALSSFAERPVVDLAKVAAFASRLLTERDDALIDADKWKTMYHHMHDSWRLVGEVVREHIGDVHEDSWVALLNNAMIDLDKLRRDLRLLTRGGDNFYTTSGSRQIARERHRQIAIERYDAEHDDAHGHEELVAAAIAYAIDAVGRASETRTTCGMELSVDFVAWFWPWERSAFKPTIDDVERQLAKAGALLAAAIDAIVRRNNQSRPMAPEVEG